MVNSNIDITRMHLFEKAKKYIATCSKNDVCNPSFYLVAWAHNSLGFGKLRILESSFWGWFSYLCIYLRKIYEVGYCADFAILGDKQDFQKYEHIVISWGLLRDFQSDGSFQDRYLNVNSKADPKALWFIISSDNQPPQTLDQNIMLVVNRKPRTYQYIFLLKMLWRWFVKDLKRFRKMPIAESLLAEFLKEQFCKVLSNNTKKVLINYEAQPWQHLLLTTIKKFHNAIESLGYVHSAISPLPVDFFYRPGAPDKIFVHGMGQKTILHKYLEWDEDKIQVIDSFRYRTNLVKDFSNQIILPYDFEREGFIVHNIEDYLGNAQKIPLLQIRKHPLQWNAPKHLLLEMKINNILKKFAYKVDHTMQGSIFIGSTASILEALAQGMTVVHITNHPVYEVYSSEFWEEIHVHSVNKNVYIYTQKNADRYIKFGHPQLNLQTFWQS